MAEAQAQKLNLLIGTYTKSGKSEGIYVYEFDERTGKASYKNKATGIDNPSYLCVTDNNKHVYAVNEAGPGQGGVTAFSFDPKSGALLLLNKKPSNGDSPCYVSVNKNNNHVFVGNYMGGNFSALPILGDGSLGDAVQVIQHQGNSVNKERQEKPHVHSTVLSPKEDFLLVSDLGTDKINIYSYNPKRKEPLSEADPGFFAVEAGNGPRHFDFHPNGKFAYSVQELTCNVTAFSYDKGRLTQIQNISGLSEGYNGRRWAADIHVSPDGNFLYSSNRDDANDIAIFKINQKDGKLTAVGRQPTLGRAPRNFAISPDGNYLLAANQNSDTIVIFKRDKATGLLSDTGERIEVGSPVCLKFTKI
ncbi:lactonase family protein [Pedobacter sp. SYSU D00535]|uniref:lactonase family protein n=1 Tax=Pedobacter sp. SYSU D00535 TaxID=2810308 RepID=UPI001F622A28|nr:lactonase family protein [Pedobacter sp. SYSU D00535]